MRINLCHLRLLLALAPLAGAPLTSAAADQYWSYRYHNIDVTASGSSGYAKRLAHDLWRLDQALTRLLSIQGDWRPPALVFAVPESQYKKLGASPEQTMVVSQTTGFDTTMLIDNGVGAENQAIAGYFAYSSGLLLAIGNLRYPSWFRVGIGEVFGATTMQGDKVVIGSYVKGRAYDLSTHSFIPLQQLLRYRAGDPQLKSDEQARVYSAECWWLVHEIMIGGFYQANFTAYIERLSKAEDESQAFSESFNVSYEDLDKALAANWAKGRIHFGTIVVADSDDHTEGVRLSAAETAGRMAEYAATKTDQLQYGKDLAEQALKLEPNNAHALEAEARIDERQGNVAQALIQVDTLCKNDPPDLETLRACAQLYDGLSNDADHNPGALSVDPSRFASQAKDDFAKVLAQDADDLRSWTLLVQLVTRTKDLARAHTILLPAVQALARHPHNGELARMLASECAMLEDYENAKRFAVAWQHNALSYGEYSAATTYLERMQGALDRRALTQ